MNDRASEKAFLDLPRLLYRNDPNFVVPFDREVKSAFDRRSNPYFHHGDARRWIVRDHRKKVVGRIAAFYDKAKEEADVVKCGGCGYFECVDDLRVSGLLFDTARQWLEEQGFEGMDGPVNFGENDTNWGCLVHGFMPQGLGMTYNFPYYRNLFESYGFQLYYRQYSFHLDLTRPFPERFWKIAEWVHTRKDFNYKYVDLNHLDDFVRDFVLIYNQAWPGLRSDFTPMDPASLYDEFRKIKAILDPELIWFAYHGDEPIAFFMFLPDAHQIFRHLNGKLHLWNKLRFLRMKRQGIIDRPGGRWPAWFQNTNGRGWNPGYFSR
ncbi:MAG: hypothetical protein R2751_06165 [Bacteroidales bacterium]